MFIEKPTLVFKDESILSNVIKKTEIFDNIPLLRDTKTIQKSFSERNNQKIILKALEEAVIF